MKSIIAKKIMTSEVLTVPEDLSIFDLATFLNKNEITGAPVEDAQGKVIGVVSVVDIARAESEQGETASVWDAVVTHSYSYDWDEGLDDGIRIFHLKDSEVRVRDIMNRSIHSLGENAPVGEVAETMLRFHLHRVLIIEDDKLVGIISTTDLLKLLLFP